MQDKEISDKLKLNYINDLRKVEIDPKERAIIINDIMEMEGLSQRAFAKI